MNVETVLFDLDSTLCQHRRSRDAMLAEAFERAEVTPYCTADDLSAVIPDIPAVDSNIEFYTLCLEAVAEQNGANRDHASAVARAYDATVDNFNVECIPGAKTVLRTLRSDYTLGLVTNGGQYTQQEKLDQLGIRDAFDTLVFATPKKGLKPDPYPFECALQELDTTPDETVHVGDSLHADIAGANAMGIGSVWIARDDIDSTDGPTPDHTLDMLDDLLTILNR
jgi:HAD superfamily hydrolase (TIGR01509 family)